MAYSLILQGDAETVLSSVNDFLKIDKEKESFEIAYRYIASRKKTNWTHDYEKLMILSIDLALKQGKPDYIPENLANFRTNAQGGHVSSIETVFNHYISKVEENFQECERGVENPKEMFQEINDQDDAQSFHFNLLNTQEGKAKEKFKNAWRLLISAYKTVIELSSKHVKLEDIYVKTAKHVFQTLFNHKALNDFKDFCAIIKAHQQAILNKTESSSASSMVKDLSSYETNRKLYELRQFQLELCKKLNFMQEAFQVLEDMNVLLSFSRKRADYYIEYYHNLALIFLEGGFYLFHAISLMQHFSYVVKLKGTQANLEIEASRLVLAILSINSNSEEFFLPESLSEKYDVLLGVAGSRHNVSDLHDDLKKNVLNFCPENVRQLYKVCTGQTDIYEFSNDIERYVSALDDQYNSYKKIITENGVYIILQMLSKFYSNVTFEELREFTHFIEFDQVKKMISKMKFDKQLNIYMNYESQLLEFRNNTISLDDTLNAYESFVAKLEKVNRLLRKKKTAGQQTEQADEISLNAQLIELFRNADQVTQSKEALMAKEQSIVPKEITGRRKDNKREKDEEEERRRHRQQKEHDKNMLIDRKMLQVKKTKVRELLKLNPTIVVLGVPLKDFTDEEISQLDFSIFMGIEEDLEAAKNESTNKMLEKKFKIYDFFQREQFAVYLRQIEEENKINEIDISQIEEQVASISAKKQQMREVVRKAENFLGKYKARIQREKEVEYNKNLYDYRQDVTNQYRDAILGEAEKLYKTKLSSDQQSKGGFVRGTLIKDSGAPQQQQQSFQPQFNAEANKPITLQRGTGFVAPPVKVQPVEQKLSKRGETFVQPPKPEEKPQQPLKTLDARGTKRDGLDGVKKPEEPKPMLSRPGMTKAPEAKPAPAPAQPQQPQTVMAKRGELFKKNP
jgi:hypothetical protein